VKTHWHNWACLALAMFVFSLICMINHALTLFLPSLIHLTFFPIHTNKSNFTLPLLSLCVLSAYYSKSFSGILFLFITFFIGVDLS
jgi:hypothetical protein